MILAGVDEAGLGPTLGPLVTASAALSVPGDWLPDTPWTRLDGGVGRACDRTLARLAVADSKIIHKSGGMPALEAATGAFSLLSNSRPAPEVRLPPDAAGLTPHPCYSGSLDPFPAFLEPDGLARLAGRLADALSAAGAAAVHLETAILFEPVLNRRFANGMNKNQALLAETGRRIRRIVDAFPGERLLVVVDKQGGRNDYLPFLQSLFPGLWMDAPLVGAAESAYRLRRPGGEAVIRFCAKADRDSFPTALASMAAKYVRERAMAELNAWFTARLPGLKPTAGYPVDAERWLRDVRAHGERGEFNLASLCRLR